MGKLYDIVDSYSIYSDSKETQMLDQAKQLIKNNYTVLKESL